MQITRRSTESITGVSNLAVDVLSIPNNQLDGIEAMRM